MGKQVICRAVYPTGQVQIDSTQMEKRGKHNKSGPHVSLNLDPKIKKKYDNDNEFFLEYYKKNGILE